MILTTLPGSAPQVAQAVVVFFMVGLEFTPGKFVVYLGVLSLAGCLGANLGFLVGMFTSDIRRMQEILTPMLMPMMIFSGYMLPYPSIPAYLQWMYWLSIYQYVFSILSINHFSGLVFRDCPVGVTACTGEMILANYGLDTTPISRLFCILAGILTALCAAGYAVLRTKSP
jgi:hypothetical protein